MVLILNSTNGILIGMDNRTRLKNCWRRLSAEEKRKLAEQAMSSVAHLSQLANGHKPGSARFWVMLMNALPDFETADSA